MGCGVSRPITNEKTAPVESRDVRPNLRRNEEKQEQRRGSHEITSNPSKEEVSGVEEDDVHDSGSHTTPNSLIQKISDPNPTTESSSSPEKVEKREKEEEDEDEEENGYGLIDGPGSPSFREYYVRSIGNSNELTDTSKEEEDEEEESNEGGKTKTNSQRNENIASNKESAATQIVKKRNTRGRRFMRPAFPKSLNVGSCYTPPCISSQDNPQQLLNSKLLHAS